MTPQEQYTFISSTLVREIAVLGGNVSDSFIPSFEIELKKAPQALRNLGLFGLILPSRRERPLRRTLPRGCAQGRHRQRHNPLASEAGQEILAKGGNALTLAVAVSPLAVVEPSSSGLGGGGFYLLHRQDDGSRPCWMRAKRRRAGSSRDMYLDSAGIPSKTHHRWFHWRAGIPGRARRIRIPGRSSSANCP